jgi:large subunit ribosomal protein L21
VERLNADVGSKVDLGVLLLGGNGDTEIGSPLVDGARVVAEVLEHGRDRKIIVFKYKNKTRYRRKHGHRQQFTRLTVREIVTAGGTFTEGAEKPAKPPRKSRRSLAEPDAEAPVAAEETAVEAAAEAPATAEAPEAAAEAVAEAPPKRAARKPAARKPAASKAKAAADDKPKPARRTRAPKAKAEAEPPAADAEANEGE